MRVHFVVSFLGSGRVDGGYYRLLKVGDTVDYWESACLLVCWQGEH